MAYFCKQKGCPSNSMSEPFENGLCDGCWEKASVEDQSEWEFCRICPERAVDDSPWCAAHNEIEHPIYVAIEWSECNEGYIFEVYENLEAMKNDTTSICGGLCTGTRLDAFEMALEVFKNEVGS